MRLARSLPLLAFLAGSTLLLRAGPEMGSSAATDPFSEAQGAEGYWVPPSPGYPPDEADSFSGGYPPGAYPYGPGYGGGYYGGPIFYGPPIGIRFGFGFHGGRR